MPGDRLLGSDALGGRRVTLGRHGIPIAKRGADPAQRGAQLVVAVLPDQALVHTVLSTDARLRGGARSSLRTEERRTAAGPCTAILSRPACDAIPASCNGSARPAGERPAARADWGSRFSDRPQAGSRLAAPCAPSRRAACPAANPDTSPPAAAARTVLRRPAPVPAPCRRTSLRPCARAARSAG